MLAFGQCQSAYAPRKAPCTPSYASRSPLQHRSRTIGSITVPSPLRAPESAGQLQTAHRSRRCCVQTFAGRADDELHLQLATAKLPKDVSIPDFKSAMHQWANTLTSSGQNMPFSLPIRTDKLADGFQMSLLRVKNGYPVSVGDIVATVEDEPQVGNILMVRFFEGPGSGMDRQGPPLNDKQENIRRNMEILVDIPIIMRTMSQAIRKAVSTSKQQTA